MAKAKSMESMNSPPKVPPTIIPSLDRIDKKKRPKVSVYKYRMVASSS